MSDETLNEEEVPEVVGETTEEETAPVEPVAQEAPVEESENEIEQLEDEIFSENLGEEPVGFSPTFGSSIIISNIATSGSVWTFTVAASSPVNTSILTVGQQIYIQSVNPSTFNGQFAVASIASSTSFTVTNTTTPTYVSGGTVSTAYPYSAAVSGNLNGLAPWVTAQNGDLISYNTTINTKDWAGAIVFQNGQYNTTLRGF